MGRSSFRLLTTALLALAATLGAPVSADGPKGLAPGPLGPESIPPEKKEKLREEVMDQMRAMRMWKLTEELKLDEATAAKVFPLLAKFDDKVRELGKARREAMRLLAEETQKAKPDNARIKTLIDELVAARGKRGALEDERFRALRQVLSSVQQAKLLLLLPRLEDEFRRRIREAWEQEQRSTASTAPQTAPRRRAGADDFIPPPRR
jgi:hypothetical protein